MVELLDEVLRKGWKIKPNLLKKQPKTLNLEDIKDEDKVCYFNRTALDVMKSYVGCIINIPALLARGHNRNNQ